MLGLMCRLAKSHDRTAGLGRLPTRADWPILSRLGAMQTQLLSNLGREALPSRVLVLQPSQWSYAHSMPQHMCGMQEAKRPFMRRNAAYMQPSSMHIIEIPSSILGIRDKLCELKREGRNNACADINSSPGILRSTC